MAVFPIPFIPKFDYHYGGIRFGASREGGNRRHAGCDLIAPKGTPIRAVEWGLVLQGPKPFYHGTYSLVVQHSGYIVRYCEVDKKVADEIYEGATVQEGQTIAWVGQMHNSSMLHLEMYRGSEAGLYTQTNSKKKYHNVESKNYKRRADLLDPTDYLDRWRLWTDFSNWVGDLFE
jgi:murein DD-endopeptidase MepM/ murein hydrolase activator NlpD